MEKNIIIDDIIKTLLNNEHFINLLIEKIEYAKETSTVKETSDIYNIINKPVPIEPDFENFMIFCNIKGIIEKEGISQKQLSEITKIPIASVNGILNNTFVPSLEYVFKLSLALNKPIEELFSYVDTQLIQPDNV